MTAKIKYKSIFPSCFPDKIFVIFVYFFTQRDEDRVPMTEIRQTENTLLPRMDNVYSELLSLKDKSEKLKDSFESLWVDGEDSTPDEAIKTMLVS